MKNIHSILANLTLEEKIGQLTQLAPFFFISDLKNEVAGPVQQLGIDEAAIFKAGSVLGIANADEMIRVQTNYLKKSRHKIPLMFMGDVIHGYETIFPVPLALASSWNLDNASKTARISGLEARTGGLQVTFSPMADLTRDARWGRVVEGFGEDPYLTGCFSAAMVKGYQNDGIEKAGNIAACVKHFAAYGASEAGREYNTVDISRLNLLQNYLNGYEQAINSGARLVMSSFNVVEGIPATINIDLLRNLLRERLKFQGVVITDYDAIKETVAHGCAEDDREAAKKSLQAGVDIEMATSVYMQQLAFLIKSGELPIQLLDEAVLRVLELKRDLGLFEDPFKGADFQKEKALILSSEHLVESLKIAEESLVLLKNKGHILPLNKYQKVALIGPYAKSPNVLGPWSWHGNRKVTETLDYSMNQFLNLVFVSDGDKISSYSEANFEQIKKADVIVLAVGETEGMSGEAHSRSIPTLPVEQEELIHSISKLGKPIVLVLFNGRPLVLTSIIDSVEAILESWFLGSKSSEAITNTIYGNNNPSGKITMSFPRTIGQIPLYYNHLNTGRPDQLNGDMYTSRYLDVANTPLFPFGFGLSYSQFKYQNFKLDKTVISQGNQIHVSVEVENTSDVDGHEVVQLYIQDITAEVSRPVAELKHFSKVFIPKRTKKEVVFAINNDDLVYIHSNYEKKSDAGSFKIFVGPNSSELLEDRFQLLKGTK